MTKEAYNLNADAMHQCIIYIKSKKIYIYIVTLFDTCGFR